MGGQSAFLPTPSFVKGSALEIMPFISWKVVDLPPPLAHIVSRRTTRLPGTCAIFFFPIHIFSPTLLPSPQTPSSKFASPVSNPCFVRVQSVAKNSPGHQNIPPIFSYAFAQFPATKIPTITNKIRSILLSIHFSTFPNTQHQTPTFP